ncbi:MAG: crotonase/enoyl-CoA hydratase family protein [Candidatus Lustribacter sp.]|jgi:enoyl-CoA hydratase/carnithine racemase
MQPSASLDVQRDGEIAILRLNRPAKRNALDDDTVRGIERFFGELPGEVRAVVLSARGEHFSAGLDLSSLAHATALESLHRSQMWYRAFERIQFGSVPVIAALHGAVIGGGLELAAATHIRVADATAYYALPEGQRGIFVGGGGSIRISRIIGAHRMMDLMLTGRIYSAEEGQQIGLSQYLVAAGEAESRALALARRVATIPPLSVYGILQALPRNAEADPATGHVLENLMALVAAADPVAQERIAAFLAGSGEKIK